MTMTNDPQARASLHAQYEEFAARLGQRLPARSAAAGEKLDNVREKHLKSAASWEKLATTGRTTEALRSQRLVEKLPSPAAREPDLSGRMPVAQVIDAIRSSEAVAVRPRLLIG
jgi:hypothetical protein